MKASGFSRALVGFSRGLLGLRGLVMKGVASRFFSFGLDPKFPQPTPLWTKMNPKRVYGSCAVIGITVV